jgi:cobalt-zinc-cadmium efflux system outer membrane protein
MATNHDQPARCRRACRSAALLLAASLVAHSLGCSAFVGGTNGPESGVREAIVRPAGPQANDPPPAKSDPKKDKDSDQKPPAKENGKDKAAENDKKEGAEEEKKEEPKAKLTLPMAVSLCVNNNFRNLAAAQRIGMAEGDLTTASLIPNPTLFSDCQLIPLQRADVANQLGPPQWDVLTTLPIDWLLFGKRLAAMEAARLGVEISTLDAADVLRLQLSQTVDVFYEVLADKAYLDLAEKNVEELTELEKLTQELAKAKKVGQFELDRIKLAVHEAILERHDRELALEIARARLRPFIGRTAADADYQVEGPLTVAAVVPPPALTEAIALAEAHRPDLIGARKEIDQANAIVEHERRKGKPVVSLQPGWTYQDQRHINGFRNGSMLDVGIATTLPITDRNQGNVLKAKAFAVERQFSYQGDRADAFAEVEAALASYSDAVEHLTLFNTPETLKAALDLRQRADAAYRAGERKLVELLDAHRAYQSRLEHVIEFESTYWRTLNRLNTTVGLKAYDPDKGATKPLPQPSRPQDNGEKLFAPKDNGDKK